MSEIAEKVFARRVHFQNILLVIDLPNEAKAALYEMFGVINAMEAETDDREERTLLQDTMDDVIYDLKKLCEESRWNFTRIKRKQLNG